MNHPPLTGKGDPGTWASKTPTNNISYPTIEALNLLLSARFNAPGFVGLTINVTGVRSYQQTATEDGPFIVLPVSTVLSDITINASPMAFEGQFTGGGAIEPYLIAPAYRELLAALDSGEEAQVQAWYTKHYVGPESNWSNFWNTFAVESIIKNATQTAIQGKAAGLPVI